MFSSPHASTLAAVAADASARRRRAPGAREEPDPAREQAPVPSFLVSVRSGSRRLPSCSASCVLIKGPAALLAAPQEPPHCFGALEGIRAAPLPPDPRFPVPMAGSRGNGVETVVLFSVCVRVCVCVLCQALVWPHLVSSGCFGFRVCVRACVWCVCALHSVKNPISWPALRKTESMLGNQVGRAGVRDGREKVG